MTHYIADDISVTVHSVSSWTLTICESIFCFEDFSCVDALWSAIRDAHARYFFTSSEEHQIDGYFRCFRAV